MLKLVSILVLMIAVSTTPSFALPVNPTPSIPDATPELLVEVATASQKKAGRRACRAQYGARLAYVTFTRNRYVCHFRKSNKKLAKEATRSCRKSGMRLVRVNSIRIKGNKSITRFTCARR